MPQKMTTQASKDLQALSRWIDNHPANKKRDQEAALWGRIAKIQEECGEVAAAVIGMTDQNPRKGITHNRNDVIKELADVAVTALAAIEHITGNTGTSLTTLHDHIHQLARRAGVTHMTTPHRRSGCWRIVIHSYGLTSEERNTMFDRVADAAHALDEQVTCSGEPCHECEGD